MANLSLSILTDHKDYSQIFVFNMNADTDAHSKFSFTGNFTNDDLIDKTQLSNLVNCMENNSDYEILFEDYIGFSSICTQHGYTTFSIHKCHNFMNFTIPNENCISEFKKLI